jgi:RimJ/RimL family protein N-acetyltransferase/nucleotide-binding universal stress UspA family protein
VTPPGADRVNSPVPVRLRDGSEVRVRPITPRDRRRLSEAFSQLSERSRYLRFQAPTPELSERQLSYLTEIDHHDHEALIALDRDEQVVGVARFVRVDPEAAEFAIVVADEWQGRGLGSELADRLVERAREEGIARFNAMILAENAEAIRLLDRLGDAAHRSAGPQMEFEVELPARGRDDRVRALLRAAAAGAVVPAVSMWRLVADFAYRRRSPAPDRPANAIVVDVNPEGLDAGAGSVTTQIAGGLAAARAAHLHLVTAYRPLVSDREVAMERLNTAAETLRERGLEVSVHLRSGEAADAVIDVAAENAAALIVLAPEAPGGLMPWRQYSATDRVCARAPCDVLIAR